MKAIFTTTVLTGLVLLAAFILYPPAIDFGQKLSPEAKQILRVVAAIDKIPTPPPAQIKTRDSLKAILDIRTAVLEKAQRDFIANVDRIKKQNTELRLQNIELRRYINRSFNAAKMETPKDFGNGSDQEYSTTSLKELKVIPKVIHDTVYIYKNLFQSLFKRKKHE